MISDERLSFIDRNPDMFYPEHVELARESLALRNKRIPDDVADMIAKVFNDAFILGSGFIMVTGDGKMKRLSPDDVLLRPESKPSPPTD